MMKNKYLGRWRIFEMELWDQDFVDLDVPGHITLENKGRGEFQFGLVQGFVDYRIERIGEVERLEFSWEGSDDADPACGRGRATIESGELHGKIYFHCGDESWFKAKKLS